MALVREIHCVICNKNKTEVVRYEQPNLCNSCRSKAHSRTKRLHLASLKGLTIEERLSKIEEDLYDLDINNRLSTLESTNAQC